MLNRLENRYLEEQIHWLPLSFCEKGVYETATATAMGTSLNKRINEQYGCTCAL